LRRQLHEKDGDAERFKRTIWLGKTSVPRRESNKKRQPEGRRWLLRRSVQVIGGKPLDGAATIVARRSRGMSVGAS
jgi:hypothetical protein